MSLSSLYSNLNYYNSQVSYWQTSASQYSAQIATLDGEIADREAQRELAVEGRDYSNGRAEMYRGYAASTRTAIANYSED